MSLTQPNTQSMSSLERDIADAVDRTVAAETPPAGSTGGRGRGGLGAPVPTPIPHPRSTFSPASNAITSPLQILAQVADHAQKLHAEMLSLTGAITGEAPPPMRLRQAPRPGGGLLPAIALLAHEIETVHIEIAGLIGHLKGRL